MRQSASVLATVKDASRRSAMAYGHPWPDLNSKTVLVRVTA